MPHYYLTLLAAAIVEVIATSTLPATQGFTRLGPSLIVIVGYSISFFLLAITAKYMSIGVLYAIWCGIGITGVAILGFVLYGQKPDLAAIIGLTLIVLGIIIIQLFSKTVTH